jgi:peptidyl-dipeptidase Dcp
MKNSIPILFFMASLFFAHAQNIPENSLLKKWSGPYGGVPAFNEYKISDFEPAFDIAIKQKLDEINVIAENPKPPTFENTIVALERSRKIFTQVLSVFDIYKNNLNTPEFNAVELKISPKIAEISSKIHQNKKLFLRIEAIYNAPEKNKLTLEQQRLIWLYYTNFVREGAKIDTDSKIKVAEIDKKLAILFSKFNQNLFTEENNQYIELKNEADFDGLSSELKNAIIEQAKQRNVPVLGCVSNTKSIVEPFLTFSTRRDLREKVWRMYTYRGDNNDANDNKTTLTEIIKLRAQKAKLMGFASFANWRLSNTMAKTPDRTIELMKAVWKPAANQVRKDVVEMQKVVNAEGNTFKIEPWDYRFYSEKVRKEKFDYDQNEVKQYLQLDKIRDGMFWVAGELFDLKFTPVTNVPVYHPDVKVWEVSNKTSGKTVGLWYFDPYLRSGKRSGNWMNPYREHQKLDNDVFTIVSNNCNFIKGKENEPVLISWTDASTLFHEFGHSLHSLCSNVTYPSLASTEVALDYVEFPSQLFEHWLTTPEVLKNFALNTKTNKPIPEDLVNRIQKASAFNAGFSNVAIISDAYIDMKMHMLDEQTTIDPTAYEKKILTELNMPKEMTMRHRITQFGHIFSNDDYAAGYYSYLWADVLSADAYGTFTEAKGPYDKEIAKKFLHTIFSAGNAVDPEEAYKSFRGRSPKIFALMREKNFPLPE